MGRPFLWPVVGLMKREPAPDVLACAFARSVGPALLFFLSVGATKVALVLSSSLRFDQLSLGTTELLARFNCRLLVARTWARVLSGPCTWRCPPTRSRPLKPASSSVVPREG